ncbi:MAG: hypothetical protein IPN69_23390 [Acidobacteria bacterium]|nr:hypothetical protein [Acidobacteriota bacterium]MBK8151029.1 hypothetical protein [Acidobacteriota bacterium]MBK8813654.1 hypothetical protein [Acidobacteriota bacterium]
MIESIDPKLMNKTAVRCAECDREMDHYNTFVGPTNEARTVCWECLMREEKGFFAKRDFHRTSRRGVIPR